jgi:hypothetical protein
MWRVERIFGATVDVPWLIVGAARALARRRDIADLLVGVAGDFVPPSVVLTPRYVWSVFGFTLGIGSPRPVADAAPLP